MSKPQNFPALIAKAATLANSINAAINDLEMDALPQHRIAGAAYSVSMDHFGAIVTLMDNQRNASAMALLRVQHEAYIFGHWVETCANDAALQNLIDRNQRPKISTMLNALKATDLGSGAKILDRAFAENKKLYDGHAHTDMIPISRMLGDGWIGDNFSPAELGEALMSAGCFAFLAALGIARLMKDDVLSRKFLRWSKEWASVS